MKKLLTFLTCTMLIIACATPRVAPEVLNDFSQVVVRIETTVYGNLVSTGSGIIIDSIPVDDKFNIAVLTARHNIEGIPPTAQVEIHHRGSVYVCSEIYAHTQLDAAILVYEATEGVLGAQIDFGPLTPLSDVYCSGHPLGIPSLSVSVGILNYRIAKELGPESEGLWLCSAPTWPGTSGGGVFDAETRQLIGLVLAVGSKNVDQEIVVGEHRIRQSIVIPVPHVHIFMPLYLIEDWISEVNHERQKIK